MPWRPESRAAARNAAVAAHSTQEREGSGVDNESLLSFVAAPRLPP